MVPLLSKSYKKAYPFKISVPSFIYPDDYVPNVRRLGAYVDEIELLCFESLPTSLPSAATIRQLKFLATELALTYNIHLPSDLNPGSPERTDQNRFIESILRVMDRTHPLEPTTHILHLPCPHFTGGLCDKGWPDRISACLGRLMDAGVRGGTLAVETLDYPLEWIEGILLEYDLRICLDMGHLVVHNQDIKTTYRRFADRITMIHLHGVDRQKDHQSLDVLPAETLHTIFSMIKQFTGTVSVEVFSFNHLSASLAVMEKHLE